MRIRINEGRGPSAAGRFWRTLGGLAGAALVLAAGPVPSQAQDQAADAEAVGPTSALRLELLLGSDRVLSETLTGPVWSVTASPGRRLMQWPMRIVPGEVEGVLKKPALTLSGGRFLCWALPDDGANSQLRGGRRGAAQDTGPTDAQLLDLPTLLAELDKDDASTRKRRGADRRQSQRSAGGGGYGSGDYDSGGDPRELEKGGVPEGAPQMARELIVLPSGRVAWETTRSLPGGEIQSGQEPFKLQLDSKRMRELSPERPERLSRSTGESTREFSLRKREIDAAYREKSNEYKELRREVRALPDRFERDAPETVWAVFEVRTNSSGWTLRGGEAGPWSINFDDWELLTAMSSGRGGSRRSSGEGDFTGEELRGIKRLAAMAQDPHPWTQNLLATAVAASGYAGRAAVDDRAYRLIELLLASPDTLARNRTVYALAATDPPTLAVAALLEKAAEQTGDPAIQLASLRTQLAVQLGASDPRRGRGRSRGGPGVNAGLAGALRTTNAMLADPAGPDAGLVMTQFLSLIPEGPETAAAIIGGVRFDRLPPDRFDAAVAAVLRSAGHRPEVVGGWLNRQLLGSANPEVVKRTLHLLARAAEPAPAIEPLAKHLRAVVFGPADQPSKRPVDLTMEAGLPLDSANHAIFKLLNSGDPELRKQGWLVLRHFELTDQGAAKAARRGRRRAAVATETDPSDPLKLIVDAGLGQSRTPPSLVPFLARQPDTQRANGPLVRVVMRGDVPSSHRAARVLLGSGRDLGEALAALDADGRQRFANQMYDRLGSGPEPSSALVRSDTGSRGGVAGWFAQQLSEGELPAGWAWGEAAGGQAALLRQVSGEDEAAALGAVAALTALAGGDQALQLKMIDRFKAERTALSSEDLAAAWANAKQDIYTQRMSGAAGEYRLTMIVTGEAGGGGGYGLASDPTLGVDYGGGYGGEDYGAAGEKFSASASAAVPSGPVKRTVLGAITLVADGRSVGFRSGVPELTVPEDKLALRIAALGQLKSFPIEALESLPLDGVRGPLDLMPEAGGVWRGAVLLPDGRGFELVLEPLGHAKAATPEKKDAPEASTKPTETKGGQAKPSGTAH